MNVMPRWLKKLTSSIGEWWEIASGALSIPFAFLTLCNFPGRFLFASLAYIGLWVPVNRSGQANTEFQKPMPSPKVTLRAGTDLIYPGSDHYWIRGRD